MSIIVSVIQLVQFIPPVQLEFLFVLILLVLIVRWKMKQTAQNTPLPVEEESESTPIDLMHGDHTVREEERTARSLVEYAQELTIEIERIRNGVGELTDRELATMIEQMKLSRSMFMQISGICCTEQVRRMNESPDRILQPETEPGPHTEADNLSMETVTDTESVSP